MSHHRVLLLTDVVDSTRLVESLGDAEASALWSAHDRAARDLLPAWRGREIDKSDGMLALFDAVADAVHFAFAYRRALAALMPPLSARAGIHVGPVLLRENAAADVARGAKPLEVDGIAKPAAARVMSLARGGQVLLSNDAHAALPAERPEVWRLRSLGHWDVKGLAAPIEIHEVAHGEFDLAEPDDTDKVYRVVLGADGWVPARAVPNNLPLQATSFVGREQEHAELRAHIAQSRVVTLLGMGGLGKTRLSLRVAESAMHLYPDGVWFVDLSPLRDPALVVVETAQTLGVRDDPERPLLQSLIAHLKPRRVLVVLDNCEHLVQAAADLAHALVRGAPGVTLMASSREALRVPGEVVYPVAPLPLPADMSGADVGALLAGPAVRLFVERAQAHKPSFAVGARDAPALAELVARLEGIPLAIELAAARVRALSVAEIGSRLRDRYKLLSGGGRVLQQRQQTLRALVDWSYDLLTPAEQLLLARTCVFVGGFDLAAAEAVCADDDALPADDIVDALTSLVDKSLLLAEERDDGMRYRMLETIRDYGQEKLQADAADASGVSRRHCEHFFKVAKQVRDGLRVGEQAAWMGCAETDLDNMRAAIGLALSGVHDPFVAVKFAAALQGFWILHGDATEGRNVVRSALAVAAIQASDMAQAFALYVGAVLAASQSDHEEARGMLEVCLELRRRIGDPVQIAATLSTLAVSLLQRGEADEATRCEREALALFEAAGEDDGVVIGHLHLGQCARAVGHDDDATAAFERGLALAQRLGHAEVEAECELWLGAIAFDASAFAAARLRFERSLAVCRQAADRHGEAHALRWVGRVELVEGRLPAAALLLVQALHALHAFEMRAEQQAALTDIAQLANALGEPLRAARLAGAIESTRSRLGLARVPAEALRWQRWTDALRADLGAEGCDAALQVGAGWDTDETLRQADAVAALAAAVAGG